MRACVRASVGRSTHAGARSAPGFTFRGALFAWTVSNMPRALYCTHCAAAAACKTCCSAPNRRRNRYCRHIDEIGRFKAGQRGRLTTPVQAMAPTATYVQRATCNRRYETQQPNGLDSVFSSQHNAAGCGRMLHAVSCMLHAVYCMLQVAVACCMPSVACCVLRVARCPHSL